MTFRQFAWGLLLIGLWAPLGLTGCALDTSVRDDPNYSIGYNDGCQTGNARVTGFVSTIRRDDGLFESSDAYQSGWKEGYSACGGNERRDPNVFNGEDRWYQQGTIGQ